MATVLSHMEGDSLCQIEGDLSAAYAHTCDRVIRKMSWQPNEGHYGVLTVEDEVITQSKDSVAAFHIHCQAEPTMADGCIRIDNEKYALVCRVLSPQNAKVEIFGGEENAFRVNGVSYAPAFKENTEAGWGQIVITDINSDRHKEFKVEMEIVKKEF